MNSDDDEDDVNFDFDAADDDELLSLKTMIQPQPCTQEDRDFLWIFNTLKEENHVKIDTNVDTNVFESDDNDEYGQYDSDSDNKYESKPISPVLTTQTTLTHPALPKNRIQEYYAELEKKIIQQPTKRQKNKKDQEVHIPYMTEAERECDTAENSSARSISTNISRAEKSRKDRARNTEINTIALRLAHQVPHLLEEITLLQNKIPHPETNDTNPTTTSSTMYTFLMAESRHYIKKRTLFMEKTEPLSKGSINDLYQELLRYIGKKYAAVNINPKESKKTQAAKRQSAMRKVYSKRHKLALGLARQIPNLLDEIHELEHTIQNEPSPSMHI